MLKKIPLPLAGLMLALAASGNLLLSYGSVYRNIFGVMASAVMLLLLAKIMIMPKAIKEGFENPIIASVMPTFSMGLIILSTYIKPYAFLTSYCLWLLGLALHSLLIVLFSLKYIKNFNLRKVYPSYFIVYVGIVCASVTAPVFNLAELGQYIFWFGFIAYIILLPIVLYRTFIVKEIPEPAMPTLAIYTAPASLCLAGYLNSFQNKSILMIGFLAALSLFMFVFVMLNMPRLLKLKFYPSYSAFTFPFVITAIAMKGTHAYLTKTGVSLSFIGYFVNLLEIWSVIMVVYVLIKYIIFIASNDKAIQSTKAVKS
ncbi:MAG: C4-dicarboxylate transporter [Clostridia bacterium]|jgi:exfoliative toxin A/B|nr:C4-dicarboxylate transporter [Clostridia bacterium]